MTGDAVDLANWNVVEAHVTVICVCLIASKPVIMALIPDKLISSIKTYYNRSMSSLVRRGKASPATKGPYSGQPSSQAHLPTHRASYELRKEPVSWSSAGGDK